LVKQQQFHVFRLRSTRLKEYKYDIQLTIEQARKNKELIALGDSELLRQIREYKNIDLDELSKLSKRKKLIKSKPSSDENIEKLNSIQEQIDNILFVPEVISINIESKSQYNKMYLDTVKVNNKVFRRFVCGSGHARNSKVLFVEEETLNKIRPKLENGYDKEKKMSPNKFNAYFGLYSSNTIKVRDLRFCVVKDLKINIKRTVDFIRQEEGKSWVEIIENHPIELKPHDGEGIITINGSEQWCKDLDIEDYTPGFWGIRNSYVKGMLITFPVNDFIEDVSHTSEFIDAWGEKRDAKNYDIFLTTSQVKLWDNYKSLEDFTQKCKDNNLSWGICRVPPKNDEHYALTNYQYLQTLDMNDDDIKELCKFNIDWFNDILGGDSIKTALYLLGKGIKTVNNIDDIINPIVKAILLNNELANDPYIQNRINSSIRKRIKQTYAGKILVEGNYQTMIADPYSLCQSIFGEESEKCTGLLKEGEHYSAYWNNKKINIVDACRSPLTHYSEHNILNLQDNEIVNKWYEYQTSGIIYPTKGVDTIRHADSDFDLDLVFTTSSPVFLRGVYKDMLPITYDKKTTPIAIITDDALFQADLLSFSNDIGIITNYSTDMYAMLAQYHKKSKTHNTILERLKITRMLQGNAIDKAKGIEVEDFPKEWIKYQVIHYKDEYNDKGELIHKADTLEEIKIKKFLNKIVIHKKPYFQGYIYPKYKSKHKKFMEKAELYCKLTFKCTLNELKNKRNKTKQENDFFKFHYKNMPLNTSPCVMNKLCLYMESVGFNIKDILKVNVDYSKYVKILKDDSIPKNEEIFNNILDLYKIFCEKKKLHSKTSIQVKSKEKEGKFNKESYDELKMFYHQIRKDAYKFCSNTAEIINYVVEIVYELNPKDKKDFLWDVFENDVLVNVLKNKQEKVYLPILDEKSDIKYLGNSYSLQEVIYDNI